MFEKEAEEYLIRNLCKTCLTICKNNCPHAESEKRAYKDGAEFGYNKAFVEADKNLKAILTDFKKAGYQKRQEIKEMTKEECEIETSKAIMEMRSRIAELEEEKAELKKLNASLVNKR